MSLENRIKDILDHRFDNVRPTGEENLRARCPFHDGPQSGRTFSINLRTGVWICFHSYCGERGSFVQLLRKLGMTSKQIDRAIEDIQPIAEAQGFLKGKAELSKVPVFIPEYVLGAWSEIPESLVKVGFSPETLKAHEVGIDKERRRIIFPVRDYLGRLAAVNGRAMEPWMNPRYKVYDARKPNGELCGIVEGYVPDNRSHLFGYHTIYPERFFKTEACCPPLIIVEGYKACMWLRQLGFSHSVALQGSSLSSGQKRLLHRLSGPFYVFLDHQAGKSYPDKFGRCAAIDIAESLSRVGRSYVCLYPQEKPNNTQPDSLTREEVTKILNHAKTTTQMTLERA